MNYSYYSGNDMYSEGNSEDRLLEIVKTHKESEYEHVIENERSWSVMYHLSHIRENVLSWIPVNSGDKVLEIGSGCGAVTGALAERASRVTCIDLSKKRSLINAYRHKEHENIEIIVGNFKDIEPELDEKYDYITLIGVLEYADAYIGGADAFRQMLNIVASHLKENGKLVVAIENQFGLKYFAGCREDHTGRYFDGIEGYTDYKGVRTFSRDALNTLMTDCGYNTTFYYPYPDYKLAHTIYSDEYLPKKGELSTNIRNFDSDRIVTFNETRVFDSLIEDGKFSEFANSFVVIATRNSRPLRESKPIFVKYSNERSRNKRIMTSIVKNPDNSLDVYKTALNFQTNKHIREYADNYMKLSHNYAATKLVPNKCTLIEDNQSVTEIVGASSRERDSVKLEFLDGITLEKYLDELDTNRKFGHMLAVLQEYVNLINATCGKSDFSNTGEFTKVFGTELKTKYKANTGSNFDMIFSNIVLDREQLEEGPWSVLDYEWVFPFHVPAKFIIYRALFYMQHGRKPLGLLKYLEGMDQTLYSHFDITEDEMELFASMEHNFQLYIIGGRASLEVLKYAMPTTAMRVEDMLKESLYLRNVNQPKIYFSYGDGYSPDNMLSLVADVQDDYVVTVKVPISNNIVGLRIDPTEYPCLINVREVRLQMQNGMEQSIEKYLVNGYLMSDNTFLFDTDDAQMIMDIPRMSKNLVVTYQVKMLPWPFFNDLLRIAKEINPKKSNKSLLLQKAWHKLFPSGKAPAPEGYRYNQKK